MCRMCWLRCKSPKRFWASDHVGGLSDPSDRLRASYFQQFKYRSKRSQNTLAIARVHRVTGKVTDSQLFAQMADKQTSALSALYDRYSERLFGLARHILKEQSLAEDVIQELFLYLWQNAGKFDLRRTDAGPWLTVLCRNRCIDKLRAKMARAKRSTAINEDVLQHVADHSDDPMANVQQREMEENMSRALELLPEEQRIAIELAYFEGLSQSEISRTLNIPLGTIKTRVRMGMQKLRNQMNFG